MSKAHETHENGPQSDQEPAEHPQPRARADWAYQGPARARTHYDSPPGLYDYSDLILSGLHKLLGGLIGDGARLMLIVDDGRQPVVLGDHPDPWTLLDGLVCSQDDTEDFEFEGSGPGSRDRMVS